MSESKTNEVEIILKKIQKKLQASAFTDLAVLVKMNEANDKGYMKQDNNKDFYDFIEKLPGGFDPASKGKRKIVYITFCFVHHSSTIFSARILLLP